MTDLLIAAAELILPLLVAAISSFAWGYVKKGRALLDGIPAIFQQIIVILLSGGLAYLGGVLNVALPTDIYLISEPDIAAGFAGAFALLLHNAKKTRELGG
jgi:hypothetical protein